MRGCTLRAMDKGNAEQIECWNERAGARWLAADEHIAQMLGGIAVVLIDRAAPQPGERVLDVGCGTGQTSIEIARRVGDRGSVLGVDISAPMLGRAHERALDVPQLAFVEADAQTHAFTPASFDLVVSRFGVMFFADPTAAFANLARATAPTGRVVFVCWRSVLENPWFAEPLAAMAKHVEPPPRVEPGAPGPFAFADRAHIEKVLVGGGWASIAIEPFDLDLKLGDDADAALEFTREVGATASSLAEAEPAARDRALAAMRELFAARQGPNGVLLRGAMWLVTATRAG